MLTGHRRSAAESTAPRNHAAQRCVRPDNANVRPLHGDNGVGTMLARSIGNMAMSENPDDEWEDDADERRQREEQEHARRQARKDKNRRKDTDERPDPSVR